MPRRDKVEDEEWLLQEEGSLQKVDASSVTRGSFRNRSLSVASSKIAESLKSVPQYEETGTFVGTIFNILSNVVGGGVLALPYAFANTGFALGTVLLISVGILSAYSMWILMTCADRLHKQDEPNAFSYKAMMIRAYGPMMGKLIEAFIVWYTFGCCVTYASVTGNSLAPLAKDWMDLHGIWTSRVTWTVIAGVLFAVCSSARNLSELKFTSLIAFLTILYVILCVVIRLIKPEDGHPHISDGVKAVHLSTDIFKAIPLFSVSYGCHYNIPVFYHDLRDRSPAKFKKIIIIAISVIIVTYLVISYTGYLHFGRDVPSYILAKEDDDSKDMRFSNNDTMVNVGRLGMFVHFAFVFPLICIACRRSANLFLNRDPESLPWITLILQSLMIVILVVLLAIVAPNIGLVLDFNGSLFGVFIIITFPGLLMVKLSQDTDLFPINERPSLVFPYLLVFSGILFSICGFVITTISVVKGDTKGGG